MYRGRSGLSRAAWVILLLGMVVGGWGTVSAQYSVSRYQALMALLRAEVGGAGAGTALFILMPDGATYRAAVGYADLPSRTPLLAEDAFRIGSNTKTFAAVLTLQLAEQGLLKLDDPITRWLDAEVLALIPNSSAITVRQLLNHTSGIFNYVENQAFRRYRTEVARQPDFEWTPLATLAFVAGRRPYFAPGAGWRYSNSNYDLLQLIIERASGQPLGILMEQRIFAYLGMRQTRWETRATLGSDLISGYGDYDRNGVLEDRTLVNDGIGLAGYAGIVSTASDLARFLRALARGQLLAAQMQAELLTGVATNDDGIDYGLGVYLNRRSAWGLRLGHTGRTAGFASQMWYLPEQDVTLVIFTNNFHTTNATLNTLVLGALEIVLAE